MSQVAASLGNAPEQPLLSVIELRYYHTGGLISDQQALAACGQVVSEESAQAVMFGDERARRDALRDVGRPEEP